MSDDDRNTGVPRPDRDPDPFPAGFLSGRDHIRGAIARAAADGVPDSAVLGALLAETLPRLINAYGPGAASAILARLAGDIGAGVAPNCRPQ